MGIPDHLTCFLRNLNAVQEATVRTGQGIADWFQIGKGVCQGRILSPCSFNLMLVVSVLPVEHYYLNKNAPFITCLVMSESL